jgi:hypothetical protein
MIRTRPAVLIAACGATALLAACSSSTSGNGPAASAPAAGSSSVAASSSAASPSTAATPTDATSLAASLVKGLQTTKSLHLDLAVTAAGQQISGSGDESISNGKLTAADITETIPSVGALEMVIVDSKVYAKLPASLQADNTSGKPWVVADPNSTNAVAKQLGQTTTSIISQSSVDSYNDFVTAASSVKVDGPDTVNGTTATHYSVVVDVTKLPTGNTSKQSLVAAGLTTLPIEMWVDSQGRLVQLTEAVTLSGQQTSTKITISKYNDPVTITAPPADQVGTG